tara:strand:- start:2627 stop:3238 length:612 start_codon:yes stop_codon:yes gene_type:complete
VKKMNPLQMSYIQQLAKVAALKALEKVANKRGTLEILKRALDLAPVSPPASATGFTPSQSKVNNMFNQPAPTGQPLPGTAGQSTPPGALFGPDPSRRQQAQNRSQHRRGIVPPNQRSPGYLPRGQRPLPAAQSLGAQSNPERNQQAQARADVRGSHHSGGSTAATRGANRIAKQRGEGLSKGGSDIAALKGIVLEKIAKQLKK